MRRLPGNLAQADTASLERGFCGRLTCASDGSDLFQRVAEHVLEDHRAPLERRKPHESAKAHCGDLVVLIGGIRSGNSFKFLARLHQRTARAAAKKIERGIVGDTEKPSSRVVDDA